MLVVGQLAVAVDALVVEQLVVAVDTLVVGQMVVAVDTLVVVEHIGVRPWVAGISVGYLHTSSWQ